MKKTLLTLIAAASLFSTNAGPLELNKELLATNKHVAGYGREAVSFVGERKIQTKEGYSIEVRGYETEWFEKNTKTKSLVFNISDEKTYLQIEDKGADGLDRGDVLRLSHEFKNGERLFLDITYQGKNDYSIESFIRNNDFTKLSDVSINTTNLNFIAGAFVRHKTKPILRWGSELYNNLLESTTKNNSPELPYQDVKSALDKLEPILPKLRAGDSSAESALIQLSNDYLKIVKSKVKK